MKESKAKQVSNREVKSSAFTTFFSDPKNAAQLYSALEGDPVSPEDIHFTTLEGVLFVARKNDLAFTVRNRVLVISEHQATVNNNMPLRAIIYYGRTMERLVEPKALYRKNRIPIPTPDFFVFYNGDESFPSEKILKLSDSYLEKSNTPMLELIVKVININLPVGHAILDQCKPLYEYSWFIHQIKEYMQEGCTRDDALTRTIKDCEKNGIFEDFVREHGTEAVNMLFTQFNMEDALEVRYEEGVEDGMEKGKMMNLIQLVCRKLQKGKSVQLIAEEVEEEVSLVESICEAIRSCDAPSDTKKIYEFYRAANCEDI